VSDEPIDRDLEARLTQLAPVPQLLVACDYDGTVADIVDDPMKALPRRETVVALRQLASLPQTHVAIISGRSLRDLAALSRLPTEIHLVGSHGTEFDVDFRRELPREASALRDQLRADLLAIARDLDGAFVEAKPAAVAFHYRAVPDEQVARALARIESGPARLDGVRMRHADKVVELLVIDTDKGAALATIRQQVGATAVLFIGDSVTDEDAFISLAGPDVGVKVGTDETSAEFQVADTTDVAALLSLVASVRAEWLAGSAAVPIEEHSMLSDQRTAAIVTPDARITWLCVPRIDSAAIFAELVGGPAAGHFSVRPAEGNRPIGQRYVGDSLVLETSWPRMQVTDYLDCSGGRPQRLAGRSDLIRVIEGTGTAVIEFAPRLDFGRSITRMEVRPEGLEVVFGADLMALRSPGVTWELIEEGQHHLARGSVDLDRGPAVLELRCGTANLRATDQGEEIRRTETITFWERWAERLEVPSLDAPLVRRSALTLRALAYGPTGAIVAAATTSLPEHTGGVRNWDYRYCWLRDAALSAAALVRPGC
jgi:trehalose-phosphatase